MKLSESQILMVNTVKNLAEKEFKPLAARWDEKEEFPAVNLPKLADAGLLGILIPEEFGGSELTVLDFVLVVEQIAKVDRATSTLVQLGNGCGLFLAEHATQAVKEKYLPKVVAGEMLGAFAITEPNSGSALQDMKCTAVETEDGYVVNGLKHFITNALVADFQILFCYIKNSDGSKKIGALVVDKDMPGYKRGKHDRFMGLKGSPHGELILEDCLVPKDHLLVGRPGQKGLGEIMQSFNVDRCGNAAVCIGIGTAALEEALKYSQERTLGGKKICDFQGIDWLLADIALKLEPARAMLYDVAASAEGYHVDTLRVALAKTFANEMAFEVADLAMKIFGGYGYNCEFPMERLLRDSRCYQIGAGTTQILRNTISKELLKHGLRR